MPEEQTPASESQHAAIPTKCFCRMCVRDSLWGHSPTEVFVPDEAPQGSHGCPPNWSVLGNQAATAHTGTACLQKLHHVARELVPKGHPLPSHGNQEKMPFKWEANKLFSPWPLSANKVLTCASRTYSRERKLSLPVKVLPAWHFCYLYFKNGILVGAEGKILGQKTSIFSEEPLLYCPGFYPFCHSPELSVSPALKGNGSLQINLRHLQLHNVHWRLPLLPVGGLRWRRFCQGNRWPEALIALQECPLLISSGLLGEHKLTCALEAGFISCLPAKTWKFWWTLESFTQTFGFNERV